MFKGEKTSTANRLFVLTARALPALALMLIASNLVQGSRIASAAASLTASMTDSLFNDVNGNTQVNMGDTIQYTVTITNPSGVNQTNVAFSDTIDSNTTLVSGSVRTTPIARNDSGFSTIGNVQLTVPVGQSVLLNDNDPDGTGVVTPSGVTGCVDMTAPFVCAAASSNGGDVTLNADGSFTFNPAPGFSGTDTFTYSVKDGDNNTDPATVSITVGTPVWFINNSGGAGDGRFTSPFNSITAYSASPLDEAGDYIFVYQGVGAYTGTITLLNNQQLIGHGVGLTLSPNLSIAAGTRPTIANITLASGNTVRGLNVSTNTGAGISGASVGTLTINNVSVTNTNGVGVSLANGALTVSFDSVSASNGANGIVLNTTTGSFTVTGTGGTCTAGNTSGCSGGTIANLTGADNSTATPGGAGVVLNSATNVSLTRMYIHDASNYGIRGTNVNGFTLNTSVIGGVNGTNVASPYNDSSIRFDELIGASSIANSDITGGFFRNIQIDNITGTLNLTINNNLIHHTGATQGDDGLLVEIGGGNATLTVTNNTFTAHGGDHFNLSLLGSPTVDLTFTGNFWSGGHAIGLGQGLFILAASFNSPGIFTYDILNNGTAGNPLVGNNSGGAMHVNKGSGTGSFSGTISNNFIGNAAVNSSGSLNASGIDVETHGAGGTHTVLISNNTVRQFHNDGILLLAGEGSATFNATVTGNTVTNPDNTIAPLHGMHFNIGTLPTDNMTACLDVKNNSLSTAGAEANGGVDLRMRQRQLTTVRMPGYAGANNDNAAVQTFLSTTNTNAVTTILASNTVASGGGGFLNTTGSAPCPQPVAALPGPALAQKSPSAATAITLPDLGEFFASIRDGASRFLSGLIESVRVRPAYASGETVNLTLGTMNNGQSVTITFRATVNNPISPVDATSVSNQGTVTADGGVNILTDDPDVGGATDPTVTPLADETPPETTIDSQPTDPDDDTTPTFTFSGTDNVTAPGSLTFECQIDGGGFNACTTPHTTGALTDGSYTFEVRATDLAGNTDASPDTYTWVVDTTAPTTTIDSNPSNPSNSANATFTFSGADTGGSGVASFECQLDGGGFSACTSPKNYNGLSDISHTFDVRALDNAGNPDASPASFTWTVDTAAPTVTINQAAGQSDPTGTSPINFTVVFNEAVTGFTTGDVTLGGSTGATTGTVTEIAPMDGTTYNVAVGGMTSDGTVTASINANKAQDGSGNGNAASTSTDNSVLYDVTAPTVTINQAAGQSDPDSASPINFTVVFSEPVTGFASGDVTLGGSAGATTDTVTEIAPNDGTTYKVEVGGMTGDGSVIASIAANKAQDAAGKDNNASTSTDNIVTYDTTAPTVTINQAAGQADPTDASPINFTVVFDEPIKPATFTGADVNLSGSAGATTATVTEIAPMNDTTFNVAVSGMSAFGDVSATISAGSVKDLAGNGNTVSTSTDNSVQFADLVRPNTTINNTPPNPSGSASASFTFSGTDNATPPASLTFECRLDGGAFSACSSPKNYTGLSDGSHTFQVRAVDGSSNKDATPASYTWTVDTTDPTVTINQAAAQSDPTASSPIQFTAVFSEPVTGFTGADVNLNGTAGATTAVVTGGPTTYTVKVSGMSGSGTVRVTVGANKAHDAAGNGNAASTSTDNVVTYQPDAEPPNTFIYLHPENPTASQQASFSFGGIDNVTFSGDLTFECKMDAGAFGDCTNPASYSNLAVGTHTFKVRARDAAGNADPSPASFTWTIVAPPTVSVTNASCSSSAFAMGMINARITDSDGDPLTIRLVFNSNTALVPNTNIRIEGAGDERVIFITGADGAVGSATIKFEVSDGTVSTPLVVTFKVGTDGDDSMLGTNGVDMLFGMGGEDVINGGLDSDLICGGADADTINGGAGNDFLNGEAGNDILHGSTGNDALRGMDGDDTLNGGAGRDILNGENGNDALNGGAGNDTLRGFAGIDTLTGDSGADFFSGGTGVDVIVDYDPSEGDTKDASTP